MSAPAVPMIEYLKDKIYLGAYDHPAPRSSRRVYFTVDDVLPYLNFHHDFGPLSAAHLYRFAVILHEILGDPANAGKAVVYYSSTDPRARANAACMLSCYMVLMQSWPPHLALAPIAQAEPPFMPFRDAGYSVADFGLAIQDVVYGVWRAKQNGFLDIRNFDLEEYEHYEMVENGDMNEICPSFVAFASPVQKDHAAPISSTFSQVIDHFEKHDVRLVVRLNSPLYDASQFTRRGIKHIDLYFDDGTCPTMAYVQGFIGAAEGVIKEGGKVAVHCRAGLGRTGCLIGAHLIYTYGFTAQEAIGYMRFLRPGMVVGPQQHWLYLHQNEFRDWRRTMTLSKVPDHRLAGYYSLVPVDSASARSTSPNSRSVSGPSSPRTPQRNILAQVPDNLPVPTPGQPRKSPSPVRISSASASAAASASASTTVAAARPASKYVSIGVGPTNSDDEDDDSDSQSIGFDRIRKHGDGAAVEKAIGRHIRAASNPSPRRRRLFSGMEHNPSGSVAGAARGRPTRVASGVHK